MNEELLYINGEYFPQPNSYAAHLSATKEYHVTLAKFLVLATVGILGCGGEANLSDGSIDRDGGLAINAVVRDGGAVGEDGGTPLGDASLPPDDGLPPTLSRFQVREGAEDRIYFKSDKPIQASNASGFTVSNASIEGVGVVPNALSGHYLLLSEDLDFWDNNTIRYEGGGDMRDLADRALNPFVLEYIENLIPEPASSNERYVTTDASGGGNGTSEESAWTLEEAFSNATAGTTVWIRAGNYGDQNLSFSNEGTPNAPIKFIGYKDSIGDITTLYYSWGDGDLDASKMPLLDGSGTGDAVVGASPRYVIVRNMQARNYEVAFYGNDGKGVIFDGCIAKDGTRDFGYGILHGGTSTRSRILNSISINATGGNFAVTGNNNLMRNLKSYCDNSSNSTDYYFGIEGLDHISIDTLAERTKGLPHSGHGMSVQTPASVSNETDPERTEYNLIMNHTAVNMAKGIEFRHGGARYNVGRNLRFHSVEANGVLFRDNASFNIVEDSVFTVPNGFAVGFEESVEIGVGFGHDNVVRNSVIRGCKCVVWFWCDSTATDALCNDNKIYGNTIYDATTLLRRGNDDGSYACEDNEFVNNIVVNVSELSNADIEGWTFEHSNFYGGFSSPDGSNNVSLDPAFVDNESLHLSASSPVEITEGGRALPDVAVDAENNKRSPPYSMGAFEY